MADRRNVVLGLGASLGTGVAAVGGGFVALGTRSSLGPVVPGADISTGIAEGTACTPGTVTIQDGEGPFYVPRSPLRTDIRNAAPKAAPFVLTGRVVDTMCRPIVGAVLDFWRTGDEGRYDNQGYGYRGHQFTDDRGRFQLVTVRPSMYTAMSIFRTPHIHAKVQGPGTGLLTTQLYLPDAQETNSIDGGYYPSLEVSFRGKDGEAQLASYVFVMEVA